MNQPSITISNFQTSSRKQKPKSFSPASSISLYPLGSTHSKQVRQPIARTTNYRIRDLPRYRRGSFIPTAVKITPVERLREWLRHSREIWRSTCCGTWAGCFFLILSIYSLIAIRFEKESAVQPYQAIIQQSYGSSGELLKRYLSNELF